jgi:hypothetical protein
MKLDRNTLFIAAILLFAVGGIVFLVGLARRPALTQAPSAFMTTATRVPLLATPTAVPVAAAAPAVVQQQQTAIDPQMQAAYASMQAPPGGGVLAGGIPPVMQQAAASQQQQPISSYGYYGQAPPASPTVPMQFTQPQSVPVPPFMMRPAPGVPSPVYG